MTNFESKDKYIPIGKELEKYHGYFSKAKKIALLLLAFCFAIQVISYISNDSYLYLKGDNLRIFLFIIVFSIIITTGWSIHTSKHYLNNKKTLKVALLNLLIAVFILFICIFIVPLNVGMENIILFAAAICANILIALTIHVIPFSNINRIYTNEKTQKDIPQYKGDLCIEDVYLLFSPDYFFANVFKTILKDEYYDKNSVDEREYKTIKGQSLKGMREQKNRLRYFIVFSNWTNIITVFLMIIILIGIELEDITSFEYNNFFVFLIIFRTISRGFEVVLAFYKDVVRNKVFYFYKEENETDKKIVDMFLNNWRSSSIRKPERISLAVHSYIEIIFLFSVFYFLILGTSLESHSELTQFKLFNESKNVMLEHDGLIDMILYSASVTFFNVSFDFSGIPLLEWKFAHVSQVIISIVLIVLSLASYISFKDEMDYDEVNEFLLVKYWDKRDDDTFVEILKKIDEKGIDQDIHQ